MVPGSIVGVSETFRSDVRKAVTASIGSAGLGGVTSIGLGVGIIRLTSLTWPTSDQWLMIVSAAALATVTVNCLVMLFAMNRLLRVAPFVLGDYLVKHLLSATLPAPHVEPMIDKATDTVRLYVGTGGPSEA